ncbi:MAG: hypothetical protein HY049_12025 [Acidobacteria bacterium]|nr:hypothetical protein [Acidobacteriota bacterium]
MTGAEGKADHERFQALRIWRSLDHDRRLKAAASFWKSPVVKPPEIDIAAALLAQSLRFRPQSIKSAPLPKRASYLAGYAAMPDHLAANILFAYHLAHQIPMMARFLDLLGIAHEEGRIQEETPKQKVEKLGSAAAKLYEEFDPRDVTTYLETLVSQDDETWGALAEVLSARESHGSKS